MVQYLENWNDGAVKSAIVEFVVGSGTEGGTRFVPPTERIAAFDGTDMCG